MTIYLVGFAPGRYDLLSRQAAGLLASAASIHVRQAGRDVLASYPPDWRWESVEPTAAGSDATAAQALAAHLLDHARDSAPVVLAVPGDPTRDPVLPLLRRAAASAVKIVPGVSEIEAARAALGDEAPAHLQVVAVSLAGQIEPTIPALIVGVDRAEAAAAAQQALLRIYPRDHRALVLDAAAEASRRATTIGQLGRIRKWGPLSSLFIPPLQPEEAPPSMRGLQRLIERLRGPSGCPWDRQQTPASLTRYVIEEAYEVVEAIEEGSPADLCEELGDLLLQVILQAQIASEMGDFELGDVMRSLGAKLVRRHPHVFATAVARTAGEVEARWEELKAAERGPSESVLTGVLKSQPALSTAQDIQRRVSAAGFDWPGRDGAEAKLKEEVAELLAARAPEHVRAELGDALFALAKVGHSWGIDAEEALRAANERFAQRFRWVERKLAEQGKTFSDTPLADLLRLWQEAKHHAPAREDTEKEKARRRRARGRGARI